MDNVMKYYKRNNQIPFKGANIVFNEFYKYGMIYPEGTCSTPESFHVEKLTAFFNEVPAAEYFVQEGKMPENFLVGRNLESPLWKKYIEWLNKTKGSKYLGEDFNYYGYIGHATYQQTLEVLDKRDDIVLLSLNQWDQIINKEEFELPKSYFNNVSKFALDTMKEYFEGYDIKEEREIVGYKVLPEFKAVASQLLVFGTGISEDNTTLNKANIKRFKELKVLDLWFKPVYKEEPKRWRAENKGSYWVASGDGTPYETTENGDMTDDERYNIGNYFQTEQEAKIVADKIKALLNEHHKK